MCFFFVVFKVIDVTDMSRENAMGGGYYINKFGFGKDKRIL